MNVFRLSNCGVLSFCFGNTVIVPIMWLCFIYVIVFQLCYCVSVGLLSFSNVLAFQ